MSLWSGLMVYLEKGNEDVVWGRHLGGGGGVRMGRWLSYAISAQLGTETRGRNDIVSSHAACRSRMRQLYPVRSPCDEGGTVKNVGFLAVANWLNGMVKASFQVSNVVELCYRSQYLAGPRLLRESAGILPCLSTGTSILPAGFCLHSAFFCRGVERMGFSVED